jgi:hypothetical protein
MGIDQKLPPHVVPNSQLQVGQGSPPFPQGPSFGYAPMSRTLPSYLPLPDTQFISAYDLTSNAPEQFHSVSHHTGLELDGDPAHPSPIMTRLHDVVDAAGAPPWIDTLPMAAQSVVHMALKGELPISVDLGNLGPGMRASVPLEMPGQHLQRKADARFRTE